MVLRSIAFNAEYQLEHFQSICNHYPEDEEPWGHSITRLIREFPHKDAIEDLELWQEAGRLLDQFYIPTRYPNGLPDLTPGQVYRKVDAVQAISAAQTLIDACTDWLNRSEL